MARLIAQLPSRAIAAEALRAESTSRPPTRETVLALGGKLGIKEGDFYGWYSMNNKKLIEAGGASLLASSGSSMLTLLRKAFPEHEWEDWKFAFKVRNYWQNPENTNRFLTEIGKKLRVDISSPDSWYKVSPKDILRHGGIGALAAHNNTLIDLLRHAFPKVAWDPARFSHRSYGLYKKRENQLKLMASVAQKLGFGSSDLEKWYGVQNADFRKQGGAPLLYLYDNSLSKVLLAVYPDHPWDMSKFEVKPHNYWKSPENQRAFLVQLGHRLGFDPSDTEGWYKITSPLVAKYGGAGLLTFYKGSLSNALKGVFPELDWDEEMFETKPRNYWKHLPNQREVLTKIGRKLGIKENDYQAWHNVSNIELIGAGGSALLANHGHSMTSLLEAIFPEHDWDVQQFYRKPRHFWESAENQHSFVKQLGEKLGIFESDLSSWYKVTSADVIANGGVRLLAVHNYRVVEFLKAVYSGHDWDATRFAKKPKEHWNDLGNQIIFMKELSSKLGIEEGDYEAWYKVSNGDILEKGGGSFLSYHNSSLPSLLEALFPQHKWDATRFSNPRRNVWTVFENQVALMEGIRVKLGLAKGDHEAWYKVSNREFVKFGGAQLLRYHNYSPSALLSAIYPDHEWHLWKFTKSRYFQRHEREVLDTLVEFLERKLSIRAKEDWYRISSNQLADLGVKMAVENHGGLNEILQKIFPDHSWDEAAFAFRTERPFSQGP